MASILKVDTIQDQTGNNIINENANVITIGASGDTITIPSGASMSGFTSTGIDDNATSTAITIDSSERVGIGSTAPGTDAGANADSLVIKKASGNVGMSIITDGSSNANIFLGDTSDNLNALVQFNDSANELRVGTSNGGGDLVLKSGASVEALRITDTGRVGIGTSSPSAVLDVRDETNGANFIVGGSGTTNITKIGGGAGDSLQLFTNSTTPVMMLSTSGNVGIGTASPSYPLEIASSSQDILYLNSSHATNCKIKLQGGYHSNLFSTITESAGVLILDVDTNNQEANSNFRVKVKGTERMRILSNGRICINRTSSVGAAKLDISHPGSSEYGLTLDSSNTSGTQYHLDIRRGGTQAGYLVSTSATAVNLANASDERLKENIQNSSSAIEDLKDMQVRQFDWKDGIDTHRDFGFVAQELVNVVPEAVTQGTDELDENGKPVRSWGVDYSHIVPRLVKVCQEQQTKIEELEARITALETNNP